jgi:hypothetical protein
MTSDKKILNQFNAALDGRPRCRGAAPSTGVIDA